MSVTLPTSIPSIQELSAGVPRFHVPVCDHPQWSVASDAEAAGGIDPDARAFLDAQLETGDVVLDLNPGFGFVALSATTAPGGMPTVFVAGLEEARLQALQDAAADAGGWLEGIEWRAEDLVATIDARLEPEARLFVHVAAADVEEALVRLAPFAEQGRLLAICISDASENAQWPAATAALTAHGFSPCQLADANGESVLLPLIGAPGGCSIAVPTALVMPPDALAPDATASAPPQSRAAAPVLMERNGYLVTRDGFAWQSSHSRTGYGVAGAHLLRALQRRGVPVSFFPLGPVDARLTENPDLREALDRQASYRVDVPSVRLSQQFDLAQHVGRGPRIGFTIFELDRFTAREQHHLRAQDALIVCSEWARQTLIENGITDVPTAVVPLGVDRAVFHEQVAPVRSTTDTVFLQVGKLEPRKGQQELLRAFEAAFSPKDAVRLVLSCTNPFVSAEDMEAMLSPFRRSPMAHRISILSTELPTQQDVASLMASADCGVFAARAEGWNLEALEMLSMGRQVIATDYSAHTAFLSDANARLIPVTERELAYPGRSDGQWAAWGPTQHDALVAHLRAVHAERQAQGRVLNTAGIATAAQFSWEHAADTLLQAVQSFA